MNFGNALTLLKEGRTLDRTGWNGKNQWIKLQVPDAHSKMSLPYIYIRSVNGVVPWAPSQTDVLAEDWNTIPETSIPVQVEQK